MLTRVSKAIKMALRKIKNPLCLVGKHKNEIVREFEGGNQWIKKTRCSQCGKPSGEEHITWLSTEKERRLIVRNRS